MITIVLGFYRYHRTDYMYPLCHLLSVFIMVLIGFISQFNSKTLFKDGYPVSLQLIFPGAIQTCEQYNICSYIYTKQHRFIGQTQLTLSYKNISINTHTKLIQSIYIIILEFQI